MFKNLAFGSNLTVARIEARLGRCPVLGVAQLPGYVLKFHKQGHDDSAKADAFQTHSPGDCVWGVIYDLSESQKQILDEIEGVGTGYRIQHENVLINGEALEVYLYVAEPPYAKPEVKPYTWYKKFVLHGAIEHDLPKSYIGAIRAADDIEDTNINRRNENEKILRS